MLIHVLVGSIGTSTSTNLLGGQQGAGLHARHIASVAAGHATKQPVLFAEHGHACSHHTLLLHARSAACRAVCRLISSYALLLLLLLT
jgi:hypothetical protein